MSPLAFDGAGCLTSYGKRYATPGEAAAASRGFEDYPRFIERGIAAYQSGYLDAEKRQQLRDDDVRDAVFERREGGEA